MACLLHTVKLQKFDSVTACPEFSIDDDDGNYIHTPRSSHLRTEQKYRYLIGDISALNEIKAIAPSGSPTSQEELNKIATNYYENILRYSNKEICNEEDLVILINGEVDGVPLWQRVYSGTKRKMSAELANLILSQIAKYPPEKSSAAREAMFNCFLSENDKIIFNDEVQIVKEIKNNSVTENLLVMLDLLEAGRPSIDFNRDFRKYLEKFCKVLYLEKEWKRRIGALEFLERYIYTHYPKIVYRLTTPEKSNLMLQIVGGFDRELFEKKDWRVWQHLKNYYKNINPIIEHYLINRSSDTYSYYTAIDSGTLTKRFLEIDQHNLWNFEGSEEHFYFDFVSRLSEFELTEFLKKYPEYHQKFLQTIDRQGNSFAHVICSLYRRNMVDAIANIAAIPVNSSPNYNNAGLTPAHMLLAKSWLYENMGVTEYGFLKKEPPFNTSFAQNGDTPFHEVVEFALSNDANRRQRGYLFSNNYYGRQSSRNTDILLEFQYDSTGHQKYLSKKDMERFTRENIRFIKVIGEMKDCHNSLNGETPLFTMIRCLKKRNGFDLRKKGVQLFLSYAAPFLYNNFDAQNKSAADFLFETAPNLTNKTRRYIEAYRPKEENSPVAKATG